MRITVIHGPNLNLLGTRDPEIYGHDTLEELNDKIRSAAAELSIEVSFHQTAREGEIIELLHGAEDGVILNPGAYAHTSRAIADGIASISVPVVEVHLSNIHAREEWRRTSVTAEAAVGIVSGFGATSYVLALHALKERTHP